MVSRYIAWASAIGLVLALSGCDAKAPPSGATSVPQAVFADPSTAELTAGANVQLRAQVNDAKGHAIGGASIVFQSENPSTVSVSPSGLVHAVGSSGEAIVTVASGVRITHVPVHVRPAAAATLEIVNGPAAATAVGGEIGQLMVRVRDKFGNPVSGTAMTWTPSPLGGSIESSMAATAADGAASAHWRAGEKAGAFSLEVRAGSLSPLLVQAHVVAGPAVSVQIKTEPALEPAKFVMTDDPIDVWALVVDQYGNGVADASVVIGSQKGCGPGPARAQTDAAGVTEPVRWTPAQPIKCELTAHVDQPALDAHVTVNIRRRPNAKVRR